MTVLLVSHMHEKQLLSSVTNGRLSLSKNYIWRSLDQSVGGPKEMRRGERPQEFRVKTSQLDVCVVRKGVAEQKRGQYD